jgi:hypothetical protein
MFTGLQVNDKRLQPNQQDWSQRKYAGRETVAGFHSKRQRGRDPDISQWWGPHDEFRI